MRPGCGRFARRPVAVLHAYYHFRKKYGFSHTENSEKQEQWSGKNCRLSISSTQGRKRRLVLALRKRGARAV